MPPSLTTPCVSQLRETTNPKLIQGRRSLASFEAPLAAVPAGLLRVKVSLRLRVKVKFGAVPHDTLCHVGLGRASVSLNTI